MTLATSNIRNRANMINVIMTKMINIVDADFVATVVTSLM